ncbi:MAG: beta-glucosidase, partial [Gammaproteobacteria bacterium]|nr:beta-glucosidase [Gammaproteobacteria bacterium]
MAGADGFPDDFLWGAATSAYQIEGSPLADGSGPSVWDDFCRQPGRIAGGDTGDVACDHYRRFHGDVDLMAQIGLRSYRFSIAWSRVLPDGRGRLNRHGLEFYRTLAECLLERGIKPFATLYHWDLPLALQQQGGWANPDCAHWFAEYAALMFRHLGEHITFWSTLNEPWVVIDGAYVTGMHPPGVATPKAAPRVAHTLLRGHALAVQAFRAEAHGQIGLVVNLEPKHAASSDPADIAAMERAHAYMNRQFLDPVFLGSYPEDLGECFGDAWPRFPQDELRLLQEPMDFLGINYYSRAVVRDEPAGDVCRGARVRQDGSEHTAMDWEVYPEGLGSVLRWVKRRYGDIPLYVTENGAAFDDPPAVGGRIADGRRVAYLREHLVAARDALCDGVDLRGYFVWSLLDNFEWTYGYAKRFGIVGVDFGTQERV